MSVTAEASSATSVSSLARTATEATSSRSNPTHSEGNNGKPRRATAACSRCRRYRQKCLMDWNDGQPKTPCQGCVRAGRRIAALCTVLPRGNSAADRNFRRRRRPSFVHEVEQGQDARSRQGEGSELLYGDGPDAIGEEIDEHMSDLMQSVSSPADSPHTHRFSSSSISDLLPPRLEVLENVRIFLYNYFQLGFLPRAFFLEQVERDLSSVPVFLLLSILTLSARFSPSLIKRFNGGKEASAEMRRRAMSLLGDEMMEASVERMQALFLLAVSDFGEGNGGRSWLLTGMAIRMAAAMRLHRESTYSLTPTSTPEDAIRSEMTRRSFWLIYCHDQQIAGRSPSTTFPLSTIDVLLPGEEEDFIFGQTPAAGRSVLPGSLAAGSSLTHALEPHRSIFASMIIGQWLWARTAEQASGLMDPHDVRPWDENEQFWQLDRELQLWEMNLPARHTFNAFTLRVMKGQHLDLAFLSISMLLRLSHIVLRRAYLPWMASAVDESSSPPLDPDTPPNFWEGMALHMVQNCINLHQITQTGLATRSMEDGFPAVFIFGVYMCGDIAYYLNRWPKLCPKHAHHAPEMLNSSLQLLEQLEAVWPLATRWRTTLARLVHASPTETTFRHAARASRNADEEEGIYRDPSTRSTGSTAYKATSPISATSTPQTISEEARTSTSTSGLTSSLSAPNVDINHFSALNAALNQSSLTLGSAQSPSRVPTPQPRLQSQSQNISTPLAFDLFSFDSLNPGNLFSDVNAHGQGQNGYGPGSTVDFGDGTSVLDYDGFGADLTAFLRGEPTD